ncbi:hypothetical protein FK220_018915 [Flavobacteriaceae bacterium TP-CH-4]|uniref:Uncharacterized protein n=1 Tax=Pelagihabitans pacificus TaxID=2696054 RepID=A0A967AWY0_9FLAO|nr:hypothetical protein [Pelagihabitans pacificus]NHF61432.1 hypothetical protein [Pelagihabitans pacificus]
MSYKEKSLLYFTALVTASIVYYQAETKTPDTQDIQNELVRMEAPATNSQTDQILP